MSHCADWKYLVLDGGGVKGAAEIGAIQAIHDEGCLARMEGFAGSSVGAIIAGLLACGATPDWLKKKIFGLNFSEFKDDSWGILQDLYRMYYSKGWHAGLTFREKYRELLVSLGVDPNITFNEVYVNYGKELRITVTKVYKKQGKLKIKLHWIDRHTHPNYMVCDGVRRSGGFPYYFMALDFDGGEGIDGGTLLNYPICAFDHGGKPNPHTIGIKLISQREFSHENEVDSDYESCDCENECVCDELFNDIEPTDNVKEFTMAILEGLYETAQKVHEHTADWERTIPVNTGNVSAMDLSINDDTKHMLFANGYNAAKTHIVASKLKPRLNTTSLYTRDKK